MIDPMTPTNGIPLLPDVELHTPTKAIRAGFRTQSRVVVIGSDEQRARIAEQQCTAAQGVAAGLQAHLGEAQRELMACQSELDAERDMRLALEAQITSLHVDLATERDRHAMTEALYRNEIEETLRLGRLHDEASKRAVEENERFMNAMRMLARIGAERLRVVKGGGR